MGIAVQKVAYAQQGDGIRSSKSGSLFHRGGIRKK